MKLQTFFDKFELFADAPNAVQKMRELVLELAVQGKLVAQDRDDEPAASQLERIATVKEKAGRVSRVKSGRASPAVEDATKNYLPVGWVRAPLAELVTILNGRAYSKDELLAAGTPVLRVGNLFTSNHWYYSDLELGPDKYCQKGDLIFAWSASFGPFIWPGPKAIYHYHIWKLELHSEADVNKGYLYWFLQNKTQEIKRSGHGVSMLHMTKEKMEKLEVMVPPLAEQKRIVAKVDELMALCDRLEAQQDERQTRHTALARAAVSRFADAPTPANLDFIFHHAYAITPADLRKTILTLAVQGKLVPQDPNDELALITLRQCGVDLKRWAVTENERRQDIPHSWGWIKFSGVGEQRLGKMLDVQKNRGLSKPYLRNTNVQWMRFELDDVKEMRVEEREEGELRLRDGDLLICEGGEPGRCAIWRGEVREMYFQKALHRVRPCAGIVSEYLALNLQVDCRNEVLAAYFTGATIKHLTGRSLSAYPIPIPPLAEQRRIVAKVDELMQLVDQLEAQLAASTQQAEQLMQAIVAEVVETS